jgi:flagellar hook-associated protein FlgK
VARADVLNTADELTQSFHEMAGRLSDAQRQADAACAAPSKRSTRWWIRSRRSTLDGRVGSRRASAAAGSDVHLLRDLNTLVNVDVVNAPDGGVDITVGSGRALVIGDETYRLEAVSQPPSGWAAWKPAGWTSRPSCAAAGSWARSRRATSTSRTT